MSKTIVVIDDSESIRELVSLTLESEGYTVVKAVDGNDGLRVLDGREVSLIIIDLNMPHRDGIAVIREVRTMSSYKTVPILMLTTESQTSKKEEARAAGATGWVIKPFSVDRLSVVVKKLIR